MIVHDRTRLIGQHPFIRNPAPAGFFCRYSLHFNQFDVATDSESCIAAFDNLYQTADAGCDAIDEGGTKQCLERASRI